MSNFQKQQAVNATQKELATMELTLRDQHFHMEMKNKCVQYAIQTAQPTTSKIDVSGVPAGTQLPPTTEQIIKNAGLFYDFINKVS